MSLPLAVHHRLDELAELAGDTNPTRGEIIAALIALAPTEPETLEELVMRYRKLTVRDLAQDPDGAAAKVVRLDERRPGRPRHRGAS